MFKRLAMMVLAAGLVSGALPARATSMLDSGSVPIKAPDNGPEIAALDKDKPSKREKGEKEKKESGRERETEGKKKYDDFRDKNSNGIDDRFEKKESPKKKKKEPGEAFSN